MSTVEQRKEYKVITAIVRIFDAKTDVMEKESIKIINGAKSRERVLAAVMWAMFNGKYVEIVNQEDEKVNG